MNNKIQNIHLISDSSGETVTGVVRACLVQYDEQKIKKHLWWLIRTKKQIKKILKVIEKKPGVVIFTLLDNEIRQILEEGCKRAGVPCVSVLDPVMNTMKIIFNSEGNQEIGKQHNLDDEYFERINAMHFALDHDDGQRINNLNDADIVLVGVSRTSKTPTCMYLANRGFKVGNIPLVPGYSIMDYISEINKPFFIGLICDPESLVNIRQNRLKIMNESKVIDYANEDNVRMEVDSSKRLFRKMQWPIIDVTRKSIEETAASIIQLYNDRIKI